MLRPTKDGGKILGEYLELAKKLGKFPTAHEVQQAIVSERQVKNHFGSFSKLKEIASKANPELILPKLNKEPRILVFDIETAPMRADVWGLFDQNIGLNQVIDDWFVLSYSAKWLDDPPSKMLYMDQSKVRNIRNDKKLLTGIRDLLDQADIVVTQNGIKFDSKKLNAQFEFWGIQAPSSYRHHDLLRISKKYFNLPSYKLEYMSNKFNKKYKKLKHKRFPGHDLWRECMKKNQKAWKEMKRYNIHDVLATEELYNRFKKWFFRKYS